MTTSPSMMRGVDHRIALDAQSKVRLFREALDRVGVSSADMPFLIAPYRPATPLEICP